MRKSAEIIMAGYGILFGVSMVLLTKAGYAPLGWAGFSDGQAVIYGNVVLSMGILHGLGATINGRWRLSPYLRLAGMLGHSAALSILMVAGLLLGSSAGVTYSFIFVLFLVGVGATVEDILEARLNGRITNSDIR